MRHGGPEACRGEIDPPARIVQDADDPRRALIARRRQPELLDELRVARRSGDGRRTGVRDIREERSEGDDELDPQLLSELDDLLAERAPAQVRLDPEGKHGIAFETRK